MRKPNRRRCSCGRGKMVWSVMCAYCANLLHRSTTACCIREHGTSHLVPGHEERMARLIARADAGLPLFERRTA